MNRFARWIVKPRVAVVIICLLMLIPSVLGMNATKVKYDLLYYLPEDLDTVKGQNILMEEFGKGAFSLGQLSALHKRIDKDIAVSADVDAQKQSQCRRPCGRCGTAPFLRGSFRFFHIFFSRVCGYCATTR